MRLYACRLYDRTIVIGFIIARGDASSRNGNVRRPTLCHDDSHYAALYAYYDNNNDSDDIACNDERLKTTPTLATVMNFIIAFSLSIPRPCLSSHLFHARAHTYTYVRRQHKRNARRGTALLLLLSRHPCNWLAPFLSRWYRRTATGSPRIRVDDASSEAHRWYCRWTRGMPRMLLPGLLRTILIIIVIAFATLTHLISRDHALPFVARIRPGN